MHDNKVQALAALDSRGQEPRHDFRCVHMLKPPVLRPFLVILVLAVASQLSGQGAVTAYTLQIFQVSEYNKLPLCHTC